MVIVYSKNIWLSLGISMIYISTFFSCVDLTPFLCVGTMLAQDNLVSLEVHMWVFPPQILPINNGSLHDFISLSEIGWRWETVNCFNTCKLGCTRSTQVQLTARCMPCWQVLCRITHVPNWPPKARGISFLSLGSAHPNWRSALISNDVLTVINQKQNFPVQHTLTHFPQRSAVTPMLLQTAVFQSSIKSEPRAKTHIRLLAQTKSSRFLLW